MSSSGSRGLPSGPLPGRLLHHLPGSGGLRQRGGTALCRSRGVRLTDAGATHPYKQDPQDSAIRIAPSYPPIGELEEAMQVFCLCTRLAAVEKLLGCSDLSKPQDFIQALWWCISHQGAFTPGRCIDFARI